MKIYSYLILSLLFIACESKSSRKNNHKDAYQKENSSPNIILNQLQQYRVYKVIDGDTFYCYDKDNNELKIRLIGIDTPETKNRGKKKKGYYGEEAKEYLTKLIINKDVLLEFDLDKYDQYNRVLAYVYLDDNTFINEELIKNGFARIMTIQPNSKYADLFYDLQQNARNNKLGLWAVEEN